MLLVEELKNLTTQGSYEDFLGFVEKMQGREFEFLPEISQILLSFSEKITLPFDAIDICGTGGDSHHKTTNISTISAFVLASLGVKVAKHGGRAVSSSSGSLDFLSALGVVDCDPLASLQQFGVCFLDARKYHPSFKHIAPFRQKFGKKTIFNMLGPLINPANITHQMVGISFHNAIDGYANALNKLGRKKIAVVQSKSGADELLSFEENAVIFMENGRVNRQTINPQNFKMPSTVDSSIAGGTSQDNAENCMRFFENPVVNGLESTLFHTVCLNCAVACVVFGFVENIADGIELARSAIIARKPLEVLSGMRSLKSL